MLLHDRLDGSQTQAAAAWFCRKKSLKYPVSNAFRNPGTAVFNLDSHVPPGRKPRRCWDPLINILGAHQKLASLRSGFAGVNNHVLDYLRKLNRITNNWIQIPLKGELGFELRPAERKKDSMGENFRNIQRLFNRGSAF